MRVKRDSQERARLRNPVDQKAQSPTLDTEQWSGGSCPLSLDGRGLRVRVKRNSQELARLRKPVEQKNAAQRLRKASTDAERKLWSILRNRQLSSYKFRRQIPLRNYIVDFVCFEAKLVIEVDGGHHQEQSGHDEMRTRGLMEGGFRVLRFWNNQVLTNPESVQKAILAELESSNTSD